MTNRELIERLSQLPDWHEVEVVDSETGTVYAIHAVTRAHNNPQKPTPAIELTAIYDPRNYRH